MFRGKNALPSYCRHKASRQAVVTLNGHDVYLGLHGTKLSRDNYDRVVAEWLAAGRCVPSPTGDAAAITVAELANGFRKSPEFTTSSHQYDYRAIMTLLVRLYGRTEVRAFGPIALKAIREKMIGEGWNRKTINSRIHMARRIFRWGVEHELIPPAVIQALEAVEALKAGKSEAPEPGEVPPVAVEHVEATIPFMPAMVQKMVKLQLLTGMRPGELVILRAADIDTTGTDWVYRPSTHKTKHIGKVREVPIGPRAKQILAPLLTVDLQAFIFSPATSEADRRAEAHARRKTPLNIGNVPGSNVKTRRSRAPGNRYDVPAYRRAITRACDAAFPPPAALARVRGENEGSWKKRLGERWGELVAWREKYRWHPHQLRHTFATAARRQFGLEHAQRALGHSNANVTQVYAAVALEKAMEVARAIG